MSENLNLALELTFKADKNIDADRLVRFARDNGWRGASLVGTPDQKAEFAKACAKYTVAQTEPATEALPHEDLLAKVLEKRQAGQNASYAVTLTSGGNLTAEDKKAIADLSEWLHYFGHALYEGRPSSAETAAPNFVLENAHAPYNVYLFVSSFGKTNVAGLSGKVQKCEWIDTRTPLEPLADNVFELTDDGPLPHNVRVLRIMLHRPEDDIVKTQF